MSKTILITGASSGFGRDTAETLFRAGHTVYASMRRAQGKNREAAEALRKLGIRTVASAQRIMNGPLVAFPRVGLGARKPMTLSISKNQEGQVMKMNMKKHLARRSGLTRSMPR